MTSTSVVEMLSSGAEMHLSGAARFLVGNGGTAAVIPRPEPSASRGAGKTATVPPRQKP
jgi:hypothetical protein